MPVHVQMATIYQESKFDGEARTPFRWTLGHPDGADQFGLWLQPGARRHMGRVQEETRRFGARRNDIYDAADFMGWYMDKSSEKLGISKHDTRNQYLAYHEGRGGYARRSYRAKPWLMRVADKTAARAEMYKPAARLPAILRGGPARLSGRAVRHPRRGFRSGPWRPHAGLQIAQHDRRARAGAVVDHPLAQLDRVGGEDQLDTAVFGVVGVLRADGGGLAVAGMAGDHAFAGQVDVCWRG